MTVLINVIVCQFEAVLINFVHCHFEGEERIETLYRIHNPQLGILFQFKNLFP